MLRPHPITTRTYTLFPEPTLFRSPGDKKLLMPDVKRRTVRHVMARHGLSGRRARASRRRGPVDAAGGPPRRRPARRRRSGATRARMVGTARSEEHTSELQSLMRTSYAVFRLQKKKQQQLHAT